MVRRAFDATLEPSRSGSGGHLVVVPDEVVRALGGRGRIPVKATFNGVPYRGSIVTMAGAAVLGVQKTIMAQAGVSAGDRLVVVLENDEEPREVEIPEELATALRRNAVARRYFESLSYSHRREYIRQITEAKRPETRARRAERTIEMLMGKAAARPRR
jgi:hypothetical protein